MISEFNSDLSGKRVNLPVNLLVSTSTKAGVATLFSKASLITAKFNDFSLTSITSPTFTIIKEYVGELPLYHMDVYRLEDSHEDIGIEEYFDKGGVTIIEWADMIKDILPEERLDIKIKIADDNTRILILKPHGEKYVNICEAII